jgi:hypothetical protein
MDLLIYALVVLIIAALVLYCVRLLPLGSPFSEIAQVLVILIAVLIIVQRGGLV